MDGVAGKLNNSPKYVVSVGLNSAPWTNSTIISRDVLGAVERLKSGPGGEIRIEGSGMLANSLLGAGLVDEVRLLVHPFVMGTGKRYFSEGVPARGLRLERQEVLEQGVLRLIYSVMR